MWKKLVFHKPFLQLSLSLCSIFLLWAFFAPNRLGGAVEYVVVDGDSMLPSLSSGDLVLLRKAAFYTTGDVIAYRYPEIGTVIHRIIRQEGGRFVLKGDHNYWEDGYRPSSDEILGKLWIHLPGLGKIFAYFKNPAPFALLVGMGSFLIGMNLLTSPSPHPKRKIKTFIFSAKRTAGTWLAEKQNGYFITIYSLFFLSLSLAFFAYSRPTWLTVPNVIQYQQMGVFQYNASVPEGIYDNNRLESGAAIFPKVTCQVSLSFAYYLITSQPFSGSGSYQLEAVVSSPNGWQRKIALTPSTNFEGSHFQQFAMVDVCQIMRMIETAEEQTGVQNFQNFLTIYPGVQIEGQMGSHPIKNSFKQPLRFAIERQQIYLIEEPNRNPLQPVINESITVPMTVQNTLNIFSLHLPVSTARWLSGLGLILALLGFALPAYLIHHAEQTDEKLLARFTGAGRLVEVNNFPRVEGDQMVWMNSLEDLLRLANQTQATIFFHLNSPLASYFLRDGSLVYIYQKTIRYPQFAEYGDLRTEILRAIEGDEFSLYFQPVISLETGTIAQLECLLRWQNSKRGLLLPADFLMQVELAGLSPILDQWVIEKVCALLVEWDKNILPPYPIGVNISYHTLNQEDIVSTLLMILNKYHISPQRIFLEIPEECWLVPTPAHNNIPQLREAGFGISLSSPSLNQIHPFRENIQINQVKLGYQTVKQIHTVSQSEDLVRQWISYAHQNQISVVAVGIETSQQLGFFRSTNCDQAQGFIISPPLAAEDLPHYIQGNLSRLNLNIFRTST